MNGQQSTLHIRYSAHQRGAVLVVSLMILLVMTIISITALRTTSMDEKMASNARQRQIAFNAAETALREAEQALATWAAAASGEDAIKAKFNGSGGWYSAISTLYGGFNPATWDVSNDSNWTAANSAVASSLLSGLSADPRYRIEYIGRVGIDNKGLNPNDPTPDLREYAFRITAIGWGQEAAARYLLSSTFQLQL